MDAAPATLTTKHEAPDIGELFAGFFILGLTGFGGVLPLARHMMVEKRGWLTGAEFTDLLRVAGIAQEHTVFTGAAICAVVGGVLALVLFRSAPTRSLDTGDLLRAAG